VRELVRTLLLFYINYNNSDLLFGQHFELYSSSEFIDLA